MKVITFMLLLIIGVSSIFTFFPSTSYACSCAKEETVEEALKREDAVFEGRVLEIKKHEKGEETGNDVLFQVDTNWKGANTSQITIHTSWSSCMVNFIEGEQYLVYSHKMGGDHLYTNICDRTNTIAAAQEDLTALQNLEKQSVPIEQASTKKPISEKDTVTHYVPVLLVSLLMLLVISIGILIRRRIQK